MRTPVFALLLIAISLPCAAQNAGKVTREVQPASVTRGTKTAEANADEGLKFNDILKTGPDGRLRAVLNDGSILMLTSNANMRVVSHDKETGKTELELKYGYVRATVVGAVAGAAPASFEIRTSTAVCGVLGTQFEITTTDEATQVHVHEGQVHFTNSKTGQRMDMLPGQSAHLLRNGMMRQGLYPRFAAATRQRWLAERGEIQGERVERNQHRLQRGQEVRQQRARALRQGARQESAKQQAAKPPGAKQQGDQQPAAKQPGAKQPAAKQPAAKQSGAKQPAAKQSAAKPPAAKKPPPKKEQK